VITLMSVGKGAEARILSNISNLGANMITIEPGSTTSGGVRTGFGSASTLTREDAEAIAALVSNINGVAPISRTGMQVVAGSQNMMVMITGTTPSYLDINSISVQEGSVFTEDDLTRTRKYALIGPNVSEILFRIAVPSVRKSAWAATSLLSSAFSKAKGSLFPQRTTVSSFPDYSSDFDGQDNYFRRSAHRQLNFGAGRGKTLPGFCQTRDYVFAGGPS